MAEIYSNAADACLALEGGGQAQSIVLRLHLGGPAQTQALSRTLGPVEGWQNVPVCLAHAAVSASMAHRTTRRPGQGWEFEPVLKTEERVPSRIREQCLKGAGARGQRDMKILHKFSAEGIGAV